jgi:uncharacterized protein
VRLALTLCAALAARARPRCAGQAAAEAKLTQHVTDRTGTLSAQQIAELEAPLVALEQRKGAQLAILVIASTGEQPIEEYSLAVAEATSSAAPSRTTACCCWSRRTTARRASRSATAWKARSPMRSPAGIIREYPGTAFPRDDYSAAARREAALVKLVDGEPAAAADGGGIARRRSSRRCSSPP